MDFNSKRALALALHTTQVCNDIKRALPKSGTLDITLNLVTGTGTLAAKTLEGREVLRLDRPLDEIISVASAMARARRP